VLQGPLHAASPGQVQDWLEPWAVCSTHQADDLQCTQQVDDKRVRLDSVHAEQDRFLIKY